MNIELIELGAGVYFLLGAGVGLGELFRAPPWVDGSEEIVFALFLIVAWPVFLYQLTRWNRVWSPMSKCPMYDDCPEDDGRGVDDSDREGV